MQGNTMLTKRFRLGAGACIVMACLLALTVDAAAACFRYTAESIRAASKRNAQSQAMGRLVDKSRDKGTCQPARVSCNRTSSGWICTAARDCCAGTIVGVPKPPEGRNCKKFSAKGKSDPVFLQVRDSNGNQRRVVRIATRRQAIKKANAILAPKIDNFKSTYGRAVCQPSRISCLSVSKSKVCSVRRLCCDK